MIRNPVMFIGQKILGAVLGAPLSADVNGQLVSGIVTGTASATADTTTTSAASPLATPTLINSMTSGNLPAGTYFAMFSGSFDHSNQATIIRVSMFVGGVQTTHTVRDCETVTNALGAQSLSHALATQCFATVNGSQAIEVRWGTAAGTATCHQRTLTWIRVA